VTKPLIAQLPTADADPIGDRAEHRCAACGYGIIVSDAPPACPMCQTNSWDSVTRKPLAHSDRTRLDSVADAIALRRLRPWRETAMRIERPPR
jgi:hypothetical protein